jgi:hypothetical protein
VDAQALVLPAGQRLIQGGDIRMEFAPESGIDVIHAAAPDGVSGDAALSTPALSASVSGLTASVGRPIEIRGDPCHVKSGGPPSSLVVRAARRTAGLLGDLGCAEARME